MSASLSRVRLTQRVRFEATHRLVSPHLDEAANVETYRKCARPEGHGHNYEVDVTIRAVPNSVTGLLMPRREFREALDRAVVQRCDHRDLNTVIEDITTGENLSRTFFEWVAAELPDTVELYRVRVYETARNVFDAYACAQEEAPCRI
jgi:6-pyruvoyltetrahydropterin/6-carboxytetrahydropterin synthase